VASATELLAPADSASVFSDEQVTFQWNSTAQHQVCWTEEQLEVATSPDFSTGTVVRRVVYEHSPGTGWDYRSRTEAPFLVGTYYWRTKDYALGCGLGWYYSATRSFSSSTRPPPPPPPPSPPSSADLGRGVIAIAWNAWAGVDPAAESHRFDWAIFHGPEAAGNPDEDARIAFENADPTSKSFEYQNWGMSCDDATWSTCGFSTVEARARGFTARYNGAEAHPSGYTWLTSIDAGTSGYGLAWAQKVEARVAAQSPRVDGIFMDDVNVADGRLPNLGIPDGYASATAYRQAIQAQLQIATDYLREQLRDTMANVGAIQDGWRDPFRGNNVQLVGYADWSLQEFCGVWGNGASQYATGAANPDLTAELIREAALLAKERGRGFVCHSYGTDATARFNEYFARILTEPGHRGVTLTDSTYKAPFPYFTFFSDPYGTPTGPVVVNGPVWSRTFSDGKTLNVNLETLVGYASSMPDSLALDGIDDRPVSPSAGWR
jgi:hypothetical protein